MSPDKPEWIVSLMNPETELEAVLAIEASAFQNPWTRTMFVREVEHAEVSRVFVVRPADGPIVGYCSVWFILDDVHVNKIATSPAWRRRGAGDALLRAVLDESTNRGLHRATLEVRASNEAALALYERHGFHMVGRRRGYYNHPPDDAIIMQRVLGDFSSNG